MKIVVGGQLRKEEIKNWIQELLPEAEIIIKSDFEAALAMQNKEADYYLGACDTGGGGALAMAISILGVDKTATIATNSSKKSEKEITEFIKKGVVAFGFVESDAKWATETIIKLLEKENS